MKFPMKNLQIDIPSHITKKKGTPLGSRLFKFGILVDYVDAFEFKHMLSVPLGNSERSLN